MSGPSPVLIVAGWAIAFPLLWMAVVALLGLASGWDRLGRRYGTGDPMPAGARSFIYGRLGWISYNGVLIVAVTDDALWIDILGLFRPGHRRLRIPRGVVANRSRRIHWLRRFEVFEVDGVRIRLRFEIPWTGSGISAP